MSRYFNVGEYGISVRQSKGIEKPKKKECSPHLYFLTDKVENIWKCRHCGRTIKLNQEGQVEITIKESNYEK